MSIRAGSNTKFLLILILISVPAAFLGRYLAELMLLFNRNLLQGSPIYNALVDTFFELTGKAGEVFAYFVTESFIMIAGLVVTGRFTIYLSRSFIAAVDFKYIWYAHCAVQILLIIYLKDSISSIMIVFLAVYTASLYALSLRIIQALND